MNSNIELLSHISVTLVLRQMKRCRIIWRFSEIQQMDHKFPNLFIFRGRKSVGWVFRTRRKMAFDLAKVIQNIFSSSLTPRANTICSSVHLFGLSRMWYRILLSIMHKKLFLFIKNNFKRINHCKFNHHKSYLKPFLSDHPCIVCREYFSIIFNVKKCAQYSIKYSNWSA